MSDSLGGLTIFVLYLVGLIDDYVLPMKFSQGTLTESHSFEGSDAYIEITGRQFGFNYFFAGLFPCDQVTNFDTRIPFFELCHPIANDGLWHEDQVVTIDFLEIS